MEIDAFVVEDHFAAVGEADDAELDAQLLLEPVLLLFQLVDEAAADVAGTGDEQVKLAVGGLEKFFVQDVDGFFDIRRRRSRRRYSFPTSPGQWHER